MNHAKICLKKINDTAQKYFREIRKFENMTYNQLAMKTFNMTIEVYNLTRDFGVALYKNYSVKVIRYVFAGTNNVEMQNFHTVMK